MKFGSRKIDNLFWHFKDKQVLPIWRSVFDAL